jgi:hypothetical protein
VLPLVIPPQLIENRAIERHCWLYAVNWNAVDRALAGILRQDAHAPGVLDLFPADLE